MVGAWDGQFGTDTSVNIKILNVNDMRPEFKRKKYVVELMEEVVPTYPIVQVEAIDPDIADESVDQNITYYLDANSEVAKHFRIDPRDGKISVLKKLDYDLPDGFPVWRMFVFAKDNHGEPGSLENYVAFEAKLVNIDDTPTEIDEALEDHGGHENCYGPDQVRLMTKIDQMQAAFLEALEAQKNYFERKIEEQALEIKALIQNQICNGNDRNDN